MSDKNVQRDDVATKVKEIIAEALGLKVEEVEESKTTTELGADSLDTVELVMALEEEFDKEIPDADAEKLKTVKDIIDYIIAKQADEKEEK